MFLTELDTQEKFTFLQLAHYIARVDGDFRLDESLMIKDYCEEMGINDVNASMDTFDLEAALQQFVSPKSRKILLLELMVLAHADDRFDLYEHKLIDKIAHIFGISDGNVKMYSQWAKAVSALKAQGRGFIT